MRIAKSFIPNAGKGLFAAKDIEDGTVLGRFTGSVEFESDSKSEAETWAVERGETRLILLRSGRGAEMKWAVVNVCGSVFEWANCSESEHDANVHVSERGWVSAIDDIEDGEELVWWYGDSFVI